MRLDFDEKTQREHHQMLRRLAGRVLVRFAAEFHAKLILVDALGPDAADAKGWLLTANLAEAPLRRNQEPLLCSAKRRHAPPHKPSVGLLGTRRAGAAPERRHAAAAPAGRVAHPNPTAGIVWTTKEQVALREHVLALINGAERELWVACYGWDLDHDTVQGLIAKAQARLPCDRPRPLSYRGFAQGPRGAPGGRRRGVCP